MYRLLIIDDEPIIVNGMNEHFSKRDMSDVEIVLAYSAAEALTWLSSMKIDVVLSDICMPEMDGMELLSHIEKQWPRCKVIFLTGHDEFEYAIQALRSACVMDYILKTEGMDKIGPAVDKAFKAVKDELSVYHQKEWLHKELPKAMVQLQRQLLLDVLRRSDAPSFRGLQTEFDALRLPLKVHESVMAVWFTVEDWSKYETVFERELMLFAIGNIVEELLGSRTTVKCVQYDRTSLAGFVQIIDQPFQSTENQQERTAKFTHGTLETIQQVCRDLFQLPLSAAASDCFLPFNELSQEMQRLRLAILNGRSRGVERLTIVTRAVDESTKHMEQSDRLAAHYALEKLQQSLLEGSSGEWSEHFDKLIKLFPSGGPLDPFDLMFVHQALSRHCVICLEELGLKDLAVSQADLLKILQFNGQTSWKETVSFFQSLLEWMQQMRNDHLKLEESSLIGRIHYFIQNNLNADVSLSRIAREVSLNPSYLSRWYKQTCGKGLSDYIQEIRIERGKELLQTTSYKVHAISEMLGFTDPHYFFRFFKKTVGCTPQEFRNGNEAGANK